MSTNRRLQTVHGRFVDRPISEFWAPGSIDGTIDPDIPNYPLESAAAIIEAIRRRYMLIT